MIFVDTNVFLCALFPRVHGKRAISCQEFLQKIEDGDSRAVTSILVLSEIAWFLKRHGRSREETASAIGEFDMTGLKLIEGDILPSVLSLFMNSTMGWNDCVLAILAQNFGCDEITTYDQDFDHVDWLTRREP